MVSTETKEIFKKLRPILGSKIDELWLVYQLDPKRRREIEGMLQALATKYLDKGYAEKEPLLKPPGADEAKGEYILGTVACGKPLYPFGLRENEWIQHVAIFGRSGSGKTNIGLLVLKEFLKRGKPFLVFDWKRNYRDLLQLPEAKIILVYTVGREVSPFYFNPLISPAGTSPTTWLKKLIEILAHCYYLGEGVIYLFQKAIDSVFGEAGVYRGDPERFPAFEDVKEWFEQRKFKGREASWLDSTMRTLGVLTFGEFGRVLNVRRSFPVKELLRRNVILELDALTETDKTFLVEALLLWIHHYRLAEGKREQFKHAILIEEAHRILGRKKSEMAGEETITDLILREIREFGESIILIDQHPSLISKPALGNTYCTIAMNLKHGSDVQAAAEAMLLDHKEKEYLGKLETGYGIVKLQGRWFTPFLVRFPLLPLKKGGVTDEEIRRRNQACSDGLGLIQLEQAFQQAIRAFQIAGKEKETEKPNQHELALLADILKNPISGLVERYRRLGLNVYQGNKLRDSLTRKGLIEIRQIPIKTGRLTVLELTEKGKRVLESLGYRIEPGHLGGFEHEFWKKKIADSLGAKGYTVEVEKPIGAGKAIDLVAKKEGQEIAIEIETGKSDAVYNIRKDLKAGFKEVVSVAVSSGVKTEIQKQLRGAGLEGDKGVELAEASDFTD